MTLEKLLEQNPLDAKFVLKYLDKNTYNLEFLVPFLKEVSKKVNQGKELSENEYQTLDYLRKSGLITKNNFNEGINEALNKILSLDSDIKNIEKQLNSSKYLNEKDKLFLSNKINSIQYDISKFAAVLSKSIEIDNKSMVKTLSALEASIKESNKSIFEKKPYLEKINEFAKKYTEEGFSENLIIELNDFIEKIEKDGIQIKNVDEISKIFEEEIIRDIKSTYHSELIKELKDLLPKKALLEKDFQEFVSGQKSLEDISDFLKKYNINSENLAKSVNKNIVLSQLIERQLENSSLSPKRQDEILQSIESGNITKIIEELKASENKDEEKIGKLIELTSQVIEKNKLDNAEKIKQEKQLIALQSLNKNLNELSEKIDIKESKNILSTITQSSNFEEATEKMTEKLLDSIFGEGTILEKILNSKAFSKIKGKFGGLLSKLVTTLIAGSLGKLKGLGGKALGMLTGVPALASNGLSLAKTGLMTAGSFLLTNPIGWATLAIGTTVGAGFLYYKYKYGKDKEIIKDLDKRGIVDYNFFGKSYIKDWSAIFMLDDKSLDALIHFDDWNDKTLALLKGIRVLPPKLRALIGNLMHSLPEHFKIIDYKLYVSKLGFNELIKYINKDSFKVLKNILHPESLKYLEQKLVKSKQGKQIIKEATKEELKEKNIGKLSNSKNKLINGITKVGHALEKSTIFGRTIKNTVSFIGGLFNKNEKLINRLEDMGIVDHNLIGNSIIKNWDYIKTLPKEDIKKLIDFDDWDSETKKKLIEIYNNKIKTPYNKDQITKLLNSGMSINRVSAYTGIPIEELKKYKSITKDLSDYNKSSSKESQNQINNTETVVVQNYYQNNERFIDKENLYLSKIY